MARRSQVTRRSRVEWGVRAGLAAVIAAVGYCVLTFSVAQIVAGRDPALAHRLAPYDGRFTARLATSLAGEKATPANLAHADSLAELALRQDPTAVLALSTLGLDADARGDETAARRYFTDAQKLSRRDLRTQLWMIEDAVGRGSIRQALHQYDIALRVSPNLSALLYPVLVSASGDPAIRSELVRTLAGKPLWAESFISFAAANNPNPRSTATLFSGLHRSGSVVPESAQTSVVNALIAAGQADAAWSYYASIRPGVDRRHSRDPHFAANSDAPSQLDWVTINDGGVTAGIQGGVFDFAAPASVGGPMLQQVQLLPSGRYRLIGHSIGIEQADDARPFWALLCRDGREFGRIDLANSAKANGVFSGTFSVPAGCPVQTLVLTARPSDLVSGLTGQIDRVALAPADR